MNVIITGAGKGLGFELCKEFLRHADTYVLAISRDIGNLRPLTSDYHSMQALAFDLEEDDYTQLVDHVYLLPGHKIDILINNAGLLIKKAFKDLNTEDNRRMLEVNYLAPYKLIQKLLPCFSDNAHIVNISSMGGFQGSEKFKGLAGYSASKAALACLTECLAGELKANNIKANCLCLGSVQTSMLEQAFPGYQASVTAGEMAVFISNFAINAHKFINGKIIPVALTNP
ncbi:MAG TPA: SDR family oxidoreductase [Bacteroidales bacterium]|nr:SDR family oxidoreductase [Bacteroidales bacterium]HNZ43931.1 SDR family oxidoreductase [Bacteroidales bacterium]HOH84397.1 SDR family oxidoreductase [Bacteroidales bacterium]HPB25328.1 SDR family oxidoreductase [Bacteroidales bacterium]HPI31355.1 SDR family oxidoreductase [Bacteroidales bacterium]